MVATPNTDTDTAGGGAMTDDLHTQFLRLLFADLDHDHELAGRIVDQADAVALCLYTAHRFVRLFEGEYDALRADIVHDLGILEESE
jgi:hypothetical protein